MWQCPRCARVFKRTNQGHYCGKAPESLDEYVSLQAPQAQVHLMELRNIICRCMPGISERIAWSMPLFEINGRSISFAACKNHISLYLDAETIKTFQSRLSEFEIKKNAVYLPYDRELPVNIIENAIKQYFQTEQDQL